MTELTENTRFAIRIGSIAAIAIALITVGMWLGGLTNERASTQARLDKTDERVTALEARFANIEKTLIEMNERAKSQAEPLATIGRLSQYQVELLRDIETALAKRGIETEVHGP